jgi:hypothetical protein
MSQRRLRTRFGGEYENYCANVAADSVGLRSAVRQLGCVRDARSIFASPYGAAGAARVTRNDGKIRRQVVDHRNLKAGSRIRNIADGAFDRRTIAASDNVC